MAATISTLLLGRGTSRLPTYCGGKQTLSENRAGPHPPGGVCAAWTGLGGHPVHHPISQQPNRETPSSSAHQKQTNGRLKPDDGVLSSSSRFSLDAQRRPRRLREDPGEDLPDPAGGTQWRSCAAFPLRHGVRGRAQRRGGSRTQTRRAHITALLEDKRRDRECLSASGRAPGPSVVQRARPCVSPA